MLDALRNGFESLAQRKQLSIDNASEPLACVYGVWRAWVRVSRRRSECMLVYGHGQMLSARCVSLCSPMRTRRIVKRVVVDVFSRVHTHTHEPRALASVSSRALSNDCCFWAEPPTDVRNIRMFWIFDSIQQWRSLANSQCICLLGFHADDMYISMHSHTFAFRLKTIVLGHTVRVLNSKQLWWKFKLDNFRSRTTPKQHIRTHQRPERTNEGRSK